MINEKNKGKRWIYHLVPLSQIVWHTICDLVQILK